MIWLAIIGVVALSTCYLVNRYRPELLAFLADNGVLPPEPPSGVSRFALIPIITVASTLFEIISGIGKATEVAATTSANITIAAIGTVPAILGALGNPLVAFLLGSTVFGIVGYGAGWRGLDVKERAAIDAANSRADIAINANRIAYDAKLTAAIDRGVKEALAKTAKPKK